MIDPGGSDALPQRFVLIPAEGRSALVLDPESHTNAAESWVDDIYLYGDPVPRFEGPSPRDPAQDQQYVRAKRQFGTAVACLADAARRAGIEDGRIGVEMAGLLPERRAQIEAALNKARVLDCTNLLRLVRMVKTDEEIRRLEQATQIGEIAAHDAMAQAAPGRSMQEVVQRFRVGVAERGADLDHFAFSIAGHGLATKPDYRLKEHDVMFVDYGCVHHHYFSDAGTTLAMRPLNAGAQRIFDVVQRAMTAGAVALAPGVRASAPQAAMQKVMGEGDLPGQFPHGHGIGLELRDYPILVPDNGRRIHDGCVNVPSDLALEPNMVLNLEVGAFLAGFGSFQNEQTFLITADGARPLVPQARSEPVVAGDGASTGGEPRGSNAGSGKEPQMHTHTHRKSAKPMKTTLVHRSHVAR